MAPGKWKYRLNTETLLYEVEKPGFFARLARFLMFLVAVHLLTFVVMRFYTAVLGLELPKTILLKRQNAEWVSKMEQIGRELDQKEAALRGLSMRDDGIYRNIFGMNEIEESKRYAGLSGVNRYDVLDRDGASPLLRKLVRRIDVMSKAAYVQSSSFDDVSAISRRAGDMASCIPVVMPVNPGVNYHLSSPFGYRIDPINHKAKFHSGIDMAMHSGTDVYAPGDGIVEKTAYEIRGYGRSIIIDHGFGYKTRYAHLKSIDVVEGMKVRRGEKIGQSGNSGKSTGPHLHYEVLYRDKHVNPMNYLDREMSPEDYETMVKQAAAASERMSPGQLPKRH
ncbi:MAG: M23 family metallopeptidase [Bacteroidales bacterium]|nr:M23 family metallopeptidase [Bacteroidales bacterium]